MIHYIDPHTCTHTHAHIDTHASIVCRLLWMARGKRGPPFIHIFESIKNAFKMLSVVFWLNWKIQIKLIFACLHIRKSTY